MREHKVKIMMQNQAKSDLLEKYAQAANCKVLKSQADLEPTDHALPEMLEWCKKQSEIVVLNSGMILSSQPSSRVVQNCKIVMINKGLRPGRVMAAAPALIHTLLANGEEASLRAKKPVIESVSVQQQRLRMLVRDAIMAEASDIHMEVRTDITRILFRKHGELYLHAEWQPTVGREIASVAFNKETDQSGTHFNPSIPQNGSMPLNLDNKAVRLRLASLPAHGGFDMVMRILATDEEKIQTLEELGYTPLQAKLITKAVALPSGAIIVSGPTGSGKTTTLAACISMSKRNRKTYTIEDPVEKIVKTATQVPVNTEHYDRSFASMGRAALRMDPDIIVLGEMRDEDTAAVMVRASITGHLVFSTLHTNTAPAIVTRLVDMGISPVLLSDPNLLACLICQRLVPKLCSHCATPVTKAKDYQVHLQRWRQALGDIDFSQMRVRGKNCPHCNGLGIMGRTVIAEIVWVDDIGREFIQKHDILGWEKYLRENGWIPYRQRAVELAQQGVCDPLDIEKVVGQVDVNVSRNQFNYRAFV